ncbi:MrcB family domain-containing protein [Siphonobacter sp. SORGH_AS_0500]|uniref:MrcB family domain-containing protein n=1 Tax=Siphonobacter sp. SORGH_AS_0500 TaxID=1864824 RepID=UPI002864A97E|nr:DUF3578 domain-containing protein [Siphonobacter sp. SORGH_AS_0500]MDR6194760.1 5-methylcytosine-specific restriction protein A [Siphonobacter sp. SORGH_AS_0500]
MKDSLTLVFDNYLTARSESIAKHPTAELLRNSIPQIIRNHISDTGRYIIKGSAGQGNWNTIPWIAIFDILVTQTAQTGFYPVFLFKEDMSGVYFSLNQGVTDLKAKYRRKVSDVLKNKAEDYRAQLGKLSANFTFDPIKLVNSSSRASKLGELYESGNILAKFYDAQMMPDETTLFADIDEMLLIYKSLSFNESIHNGDANVDEIDIAVTDEEGKFKGIEKLQKFNFHKAVERNGRLVKLVKNVQGYTCKACDFNFEEKYGELGKSFIEAHHLVPISTLDGIEVELDARKDFVVLCSNCHRMIHKLKDPSDVHALKVLITPKLHP